MISKELFVKTINFLKEKDDFQIKINNMFTKEFGDCILYPYDSWANMIIELLSAGFDYDEEIISDWIYHYILVLDFGKDWKSDCVTETKKDADGNEIEVDIPLATPEDLYDMLFKTACGDKIKEKE